MSKLLLVVSLMMSGSWPAQAAADDPLTGIFGGDRATLTLTANGGRLVMDCAESLIAEPVRPDAAGRFSVTGSHEDYAPGPQQADVPPPAARASFAGKLVGDTLELTITAANNSRSVLRLTRGRAVKPVRCL